MLRERRTFWNGGVSCGLFSFSFVLVRTALRCRGHVWVSDTFFPPALPPSLSPSLPQLEEGKALVAAAEKLIEETQAKMHLAATKRTNKDSLVQDVWEKNPAIKQEVRAGGRVGGWARLGLATGKLEEKIFQRGACCRVHCPSFFFMLSSPLSLPPSLPLSLPLSPPTFLPSSLFAPGLGRDREPPVVQGRQVSFLALSWRQDKGQWEDPGGSLRRCGERPRGGRVGGRRGDG